MRWLSGCRMMLEILTVILTSIQILSAPAATAAPTFAKFTAQHFLRNLIQHELAENMVFILHENSKLFLDVLTDKLGWNY